MCSQSSSQKVAVSDSFSNRYRFYLNNIGYIAIQELFIQTDSVNNCISDTNQLLLAKVIQVKSSYHYEVIIPLVTTLYKAYNSTLLRLMHLQASEDQLITCGIITQIARLAMLLILQSTSCFPLYACVWHKNSFPRYSHS